MGYPEKEIWRMTLRKLDKLIHEYCLLTGIRLQRNDDNDIPEDVI
jgi:hypothetical protein